MPNVDLDSWIVSLSGRLSHQWDFTFYKNSGEIANQVRTELGAYVKEINIDSDGDIDVKAESYGSYFIRPNGIVAGGWLTDVKHLSEQGEDVAAFGQLIESVYKATKGPFTIDSYGIRLFLRFSPENTMNLMRSLGFDRPLHSIFGDKTPSDLQSLKYSTSYVHEKFSDSVELEASLKDIQLRYSRDSVGTNFSSYRMFLSDVNFKTIIDDLRPICEPLAAAEPRKRFAGGLKGRLSDLR
jgi:hypothetical protein